MWMLPGGGLEFGEDPAPGVLRELREETGLDGVVEGLLGVRSAMLEPDQTKSGHRIQNVGILYRVAVTGGALRNEIDESTDLAAWVRVRRARRAPDRAPRGLGTHAGRPLMHSVIGIDIAASPELVYRLARDVTRWERLLPHYSRSAVVRTDAGRRPRVRLHRAPAVRARAGLGHPGDLAQPDLARPRDAAAAVRPRRGATKGMDVTWTIEPRRLASGRRRAPGWRSPTSSRPRSPGSRRSSTLRSRARSRGARSPRSARSPRRSRRPIAPPPTNADMTATVAGVWITGIGVITADRDRAATAFRAGLRAARSPGQADRPLRPVAVPVAGRGPGRRLRPARPGWPPKTARQLDRFSQFGLVAGRLALDDAGLVPGAGGAADPERIGIYLGSALGGIAFAEEQHEKYLERGIRSVAPNLALAVFGGAAPANLGIALDVRGPDPVDGQLVRVAAPSRSARRSKAIRSGEIDAAIAGGVEVPLSPLAFGAFDLIRALSHGFNDDPVHASRPMDGARDGFVMGEGAALLVIEALDVAVARGARIYAEVLGYAATSDAHHMVQPRADGREAGRAITLALADAGVAARRDRLGQRARELHADR